MRTAPVSFLVLLGLAAVSTAAADVYPLPPSDVDLIGAVHTDVVRKDETLLDVARRNGVGYNQIRRANPDLDLWIPEHGTDVVIPSRHVLPEGPRTGLVLNLPEFRLYYFPEAKKGARPVVVTHPISIGRQDWHTPLGLSKITDKVRDPSWYPPESVRAEHAAEGDPLPKVVPPGPDNPLGHRAMRLSIPGYLIHGTNKPAGLGMRVSHGCIRMYPEDIESLFEEVPVGTQVRIVNQPYKIGRAAGTLFLEAHPPLFEDEDNNERGMTKITKLLIDVSDAHADEVDWTEIERAFRSSHGMPVPLNKGLPDDLSAEHR